MSTVRKRIALALAAGVLLVPALSLPAPRPAVAAEAPQIAPADAKEQAALKAFSEARQGQPLWIVDGAPTPAARALVERLGRAAEHGLDPAAYGAMELAARLGSATVADAPALETALSLALVRYGADVKAGQVRPAKLMPDMFREPVRPDPASLLQQAAAATDPGAWLDTLPPQTVEYARLKEALVAYRALAANGGWPTVPAGETLKPGMTDARVPALRARLAVTGELPAAAAAEPELYDEQLVEAVKRFQERHGLDVDGAVGKGTLAALNVPVADRIRQMEMNLERRRWLPEDLGRKYVFVNVADFELKVVDRTDPENQRTLHDDRVVVGKAYTKTPLFSAEMTQIELNPYWNVPYSIASKELLPKIKQDPGYLERNNYLLLASAGRNSSAVDPHGVDWGGIGSRNFPFSIRQLPGEGNALGRVVFRFPNPHAIYMHDTPSRMPFTRTVRTFSHGCVRVQNPLALATLLLEPTGQWPRERIEEVTAGDEFTVVPLPEKLPVHITYLTAWANKDGSIHFRDDVYGRDAILKKALFGG